MLEMAQLKQRHLYELDKVKNEVEEAMKIKMEGQLAAQFRRFDAEKVELYDQLREYEKANSDYIKLKKKFLTDLSLTRWFFTAKIKGIKAETNLELKSQKIHEVER